VRTLAAHNQTAAILPVAIRAADEAPQHCVGLAATARAAKENLKDRTLD
jgi:hypothetical protein